MSRELANLIAKRFVARTDVKAMQSSTGAYFPVRVPRGMPDEGQNLPWTRDDFNNHLAGKQTFGHYLVNTSDQCKLFAFDIDLEKTGFLPKDEGYSEFEAIEDLRGAWHQRVAPPSHALHDPFLWARREWMKVQFRLFSHLLARETRELLGLDVAVAYSGNKGLHVYGFFPAPIPSRDAREGAMMVLESIGEFQPKTPNNEIFFKHKDDNPLTGFPNLSVEIYPKQDSIANKDLGNLLRLPLGKNQKSPDPTFFVDMTVPANILQPTDPIAALTPGNDPWVKANG